MKHCIRSCTVSSYVISGLRCTWYVALVIACLYIHLPTGPLIRLEVCAESCRFMCHFCIFVSLHSNYSVCDIIRTEHPVFCFILFFCSHIIADDKISMLLTCSTHQRIYHCCEDLSHTSDDETLLCMAVCSWSNSRTVQQLAYCCQNIPLYSWVTHLVLNVSPLFVSPQLQKVEGIEVVAIFQQCS